MNADGADESRFRKRENPAAELRTQNPKQAQITDHRLQITNHNCRIETVSQMKAGGAGAGDNLAARKAEVGNQNFGQNPIADERRWSR
jgi:hypothetical protein